MSRAVKPKPLYYKYRNRHTGKESQLLLAEVFEDWFAEQFADPGDIQVTRDVRLNDGDAWVFDGMNYSEQAEYAEKLGSWLIKYSKWIKTRKTKEDPNG
jgi:hypothetical protein